MRPVPPPFTRRNLSGWFNAWNAGTNDGLYVVVAYFRLASKQAKDAVDEPLPMLFTQDQIITVNARRRQVIGLYEAATKPGAHTEDLVVAAEHTWLSIYRLYERVPTMHRIPPPKTR